MPNIFESENIETGTSTCYPSYSDIESGSSVHKALSIVHLKALLKLNTYVWNCIAGR